MKNIKDIIKKNKKLYYKLLSLRYKRKVTFINRMTIEDKKKYLNQIFREMTDQNINWENPVKFNEKIQYIKLYGKNNEIYAKLADKYAVRSWIKEKIGEEYLIPLIGVYDSFDEIHFEDLPDRFVIKCTHDSASVTVVKNKNEVNWKDLKYKYDYHMQTDFYYFSLEKHYSLIKPRIVIEEYIGSINSVPTDYKMWCFDAKVCFCGVYHDRFNDCSRSMYDANWNLLDWGLGNFKSHEIVEKPQNYEQMISLAETLSEGFPFVRVDFYNIDGKIYFGEMTFTPASGFVNFTPEVDEMLGSMWRNFENV